MDALAPLPILGPAGVTTGNDDFLTKPPTARVITVPGLAWREPESIPLWAETENTPETTHKFLTSFSRASRVIGPESSEDSLEIEARKLLDQLGSNKSHASGPYIMWAEDIGGIIVKLALVIAACEARYRNILNATQAVILFGTPHRASSTQSLDSAVLAIIEAYHPGQLGDWLPIVVNRLSKQLNNIHDRFHLISHRFGIISYYQEPSPSTLYQVIVPKECATLGLENEVTIGCDRPHKNMADLVSPQDQFTRQTLITNINLGKWGIFTHFLGILGSVHPKGKLNRPVWSILRSAKVISRCTRNSELADWISSKDTRRYMKIRLGGTIDPLKLLNSMAQVIRIYHGPLWFSCLPIEELQGTGSALRDQICLSAGLLQQILIQHPQTYLHIQHLVPLLADAIRGNLDSWLDKILWLSLRTAMHAPIGIPTNVLLYVATPASVNMIRRINSALHGTESKLKLVLAYTDDSSVSLGDINGFDLRLNSEDLEDCHQDGTSLPLEIATDPSIEQDSIQPTSPGKAVQQHTATKETLMQLLVLQIRAMGRPMFIILIWIVFASRPLYIDELDFILTFDNNLDLAEAGASVTSPTGSVLGILKLLPDLTVLEVGRVFLRGPYDEMRNILLELSRTYLPPSSSPHLYIAQSCFSLLGRFILKNVQKGWFIEDPQDEETEMSDRSQGSDVDSDDTGDINMDTFTPQLVHELILAEYTIQNCIFHYEMANLGKDLGNVDEACSVFFKNEENVRSWLYLVEYLACLRPPRIGQCIGSFNSLLKLFDTTKIQDLKTLYRLANRPSSLSTEARLLIDAAEVGSEIIIRCTKLGSIPEAAVFRALATTSGTVFDGLRKSCASVLEQDSSGLAQIQLTAQVLGNNGTSKLLVAELLSLPSSPERDLWHMQALHRAVEYCDDELIAELLKRGELKGRIEISNEPSWTTIHRAASRGNLQVMTWLWEAGLTHAVNTPSPDNRRPLFIACSYGFVEIAEFLIRNGARIDDANGSLKQTALHRVSHHGYWETAKTLLNHHINITAVDTRGNFALHFAIQRANTPIAELLIKHFPSIQAPDQPSGNDVSVMLPAEESPDEDLHRLSSEAWMKYIFHASEERNLAIKEPPGRFKDFPLDGANWKGVNALFAAAERDLPTVGMCLLERKADPNLLDDGSRSALHMAARAGSVAFIKMLLERGAETNHGSDKILLIPLHLACYRGHSDAIDILADSSDLSIEDKWGRTPLSAACTGGHLEAVKVLLHRYDKQDWIQGLICSARYSHRDILIYLLDMGCAVNGTDENRDGALSYAAASDNARIAQILILRGANPALANSSGQLPLHLASRNGCFETAKILIEAGTQLDVEDNNGDTPLGEAIYAEHVKVVRLLIERGAKMRVPPYWSRYNSLFEFSSGLSTIPVTEVLLSFYQYERKVDGLTPAQAVIIALKRQSGPLLRLVLDKLFNGSANGSAGEALYYAIAEGEKDLLDIILDNQFARASINEQHPKHGTPLHAAICAVIKSDEMVDLLLRYGADPKIVAGRFGTTINAACAAGKSKIAETLLKVLPEDLLTSVTGKYGTAIQSALVGFQNKPAESTIQMLDLLKEQGVPIFASGGLYGSAFHAAAYLSCREVVAWFLKIDGLVAIATDATGRIPIHLALVHGEWDIVDDMLQSFHGTSWGSMREWTWWIATIFCYRDSQGRTGLHYAAISASETIMDKIFSLPDDEGRIRGLVNSKDNDDWTPLHWACQQPKKEIVNMLLKNDANPKALTIDSWSPRHIAVLQGVTDEEYLKDLPDTGERPEGLPNGAGGRFNKVYCNVCFVRVFWKYYRCMNEECDDFVMCFKCNRHAESVHHTGHDFMCITKT
ncbi:ankyrin repeat-containing domain protein [Xylaria telfairii]|nr:ankyrin repeat-containing domain protein [Xylaria telfairii]